ncbi:hypothetical protein [Actinoplanes sp. OR16]|uniref:hypothetical protein n=1 Tax=Actinoplanes sp. OR16 TaxID=946334 RepID=UPI000FD8C267|nr:hypothetical protein [Actinoplanes sp. OR16]
MTVDQEQAGPRTGAAIGVVVAVLAAVGIGLLLRDPIVLMARSASGGSGAGMAAAGWLVAVAPFVALGSGLRRTGRSRILCGALAALFGGVLFWFVPLSSRYIAGVVSGPGGAGFITGLHWGLATVGVAALATPFVLAIARPSDRGQTIVFLAAAGGFVTLSAAVLQAW